MEGSNARVMGASALGKPNMGVTDGYILLKYGDD